MSAPDGPRPSAGERMRAAQADYERQLAEVPPLVAAVVPAELGAASPDEATPSDGRVLTRDELLDALREQAAPSDGVAAAVRPDVGPAAVFAVAWRCVVYQQIRALLVLTDAGLQDAGLLNARVALEHAAVLADLRAAAVAGTDRAFLERLQVSAGEEEKRTMKALTALAGTAGGPPAALVEETEQVLAGNRSTGHRADAPMTNFPTMKVVYRQLSDAAHAGFGSAGPYLLEYARTGNLGGLPTPARWAEVLAHLVWACWCADATVDHFLVEGATADRHRPVLDRLGVPFTL